MTYSIDSSYDIRVNDTFVMVGGLVNDYFSDKLRIYLPGNKTLVELPGKMKVPRMDTTAILVERSIFPPCA